MTLRERTARFMDRGAVRSAIVAVILFNAAVLGAETSAGVMSAAGPLVVALDRICLGIFVAELLAKMFAHGWRFFRSGWNLFDFAVVAIALVPAGEGLSVLRALRVLRVLRVVSAAPRLRRVVEGFVTALPGMGSVFVLMALIFYIGAVMATKLFGASCPGCTAEQAALMREWFGTLGRSAYSLFQIMTLESWSMGIVRPVMEIWPRAWMFFIPFIMLTTFAVVNLLVGLIVNSMQDVHARESNAAADSHRDEVLRRLEAIEKRLDRAR